MQALSQSIRIRVTESLLSTLDYSACRSSARWAQARRFFYGPGIDNFDMALQKAVPLTERKSLEFRVEAFNVFNHAQFYGPAAVNGDINSVKFGQVVSAAPPRLVQLAARFVF